MEEIVAMSCEDLLGSSQRLQEAMTEFYAQNEKAANSFTKYVREVLNRLKIVYPILPKMSTPPTKKSETSSESRHPRQARFLFFIFCSNFFIVLL